MTGVRELVEVRLISAAPEQVRLSFLGGHTQLDASLPLDAPIASLLPEVVKLVRSREEAQSPAADDAAARQAKDAKEAKDRFWMLTRLDGEPLSPDATLREAGVVNGELLRLTAERALSAPTLYDDVVDAAARLNRAAYVGWNPTAAGWLAFVGVHLASILWAYLLLADAFRPVRGPLVGLSVVVALTLVGVATLAHRSYGQSTIGAALGWAAIPIGAAVAWTLLSGLGGFALGAGCVALILLMWLSYRVVGTGHGGYLAAGAVVALCGIAFAVQAAGVRPELVGAGLAVVTAFACLLVPRATARLSRFATPAVTVDAERDDVMFENPFVAPEPAAEPEGASDTGPSTPTAETVWARVRFAMLTRSGLYTALGVGAGIGAAIVLDHQQPVQWSGWAFALVTAAAVGLYARRPATATERAALGLPAVALTAYACWAAQTGPTPMPLVAFGVVLAASVVFAVVGANPPGRRGRARLRTLLSYLEYAASAALIPIALWVAGVYGRLGIG